MAQTLINNIKKKVFTKQLSSSVSEKAPLATIQQANITLARSRVVDYLLYEDFDDSSMVMLNSGELHLGFGFSIGSWAMAGDDTAEKIENIYKSAPKNTVIQWMEIGSDNILPTVKAWESRQNKYCKSALLKKQNHYRAKMLLDSTTKPLHKPSNQYLRNIERYIFFTLHFSGHLDIEHEVETFLTQLEAYRQSVEGTLQDASLNPHLLDRKRAIRVIRKQLNPHQSSDFLNSAELEDESIPFKDHVALKTTNMQFKDNGDIIFDSGAGDEIACIHMTTDKIPEEPKLSSMGMLTGDMLNRDYRINRPYCLYNIIHVPDPDTTREAVETSLSWLSKQAAGESQTLKDLMPHMFQRRDDSKMYIKSLGEGQVPIRMYQGIKLYVPQRSATLEADQLLASWSNKGFVISRERHIAFPAWIASLPWSYRWYWDKPRSGLMRARLAKSINAASTSLCTGDWTGNVPVMEEDRSKEDGSEYLYINGIPLVSGRGAISFIDIFKAEVNYNFAIIATSGAGKSFFANDLIRDIRSRDGLVFVFDMGGSYRDLNEILEGTNLTFPIGTPFSINHFWGIEDAKTFNELFPVLKASLQTMAFEKGEPTDHEASALDIGLFEAWQKHQGRLGLKEIYDDFNGSSDKELKRLSRLLYSYAYGPQAGWFNGEPKVDLDNPFTILELNELQNDPALKSVVFTTIISLVTRRIYNADRSIPKLLLIDEAWSLLDDSRAAPFIEQAFRTIRKFFGAAGIITQSCKDVDISRAARAAFDNSAWRFFLMQKSTSVAYAKEKELLSDSGDGYVFRVMSSLMRRDNFSEVMVEHDGMFTPYRFFVDPYSSWVYSSKAQDKVKLNRISDSLGCDRDTSIEIAAGLKDPNSVTKEQKTPEVYDETA